MSQLNATHATHLGFQLLLSYMKIRAYQAVLTNFMLSWTQTLELKMSHLLASHANTLVLNAVTTQIFVTHVLLDLNFTKLIEHVLR